MRGEDQPRREEGQKLLSQSRKELEKKKASLERKRCYGCGNSDIVKQNIRRLSVSIVMARGIGFLNALGTQNLSRT